MGGSNPQWYSPQWISGLQNALGPWLAQNFSQQQGSYPGYLSSAPNDWLNLVGGGLTGMLYGGQPTGLQAQSNALAGFLGMPMYGAYNPTPQYLNYGYPQYNPYTVQGYTPGSNTGRGPSGGGTPGDGTGRGSSGNGTGRGNYPPNYWPDDGSGGDGSLLVSQGGPWAMPQNMRDAWAEMGYQWDPEHGGFSYVGSTPYGSTDPREPTFPQPQISPGTGAAGRPGAHSPVGSALPGGLANSQAAQNSGGGYDETSYLRDRMNNNGTYGFPSGRNQQTAGQDFWNPYPANTLPSQFGSSDYTGQSSWLNQVPGMVGQGIGGANSLIAQLLGQTQGGQVPWTAQNSFEAMLTTKGWNDAPFAQAQNYLSGLLGSTPGIWSDVQGNLNDIMATGAPVNVTPQWQQMTGAMDIQRDKNLAQAAESYAAGNKRFGSGAANQFGNVAAEAAAQQNALLGQMTQNALEAAANRRLTATGQGAALGQMQAQLPIEQANALLQSGAIDRSTWANLLGAASGAASDYGNMMVNAGNRQFSNVLDAAGLLGNLGIQGANVLGNLGLEATQMQGQNAQQQYNNQLQLLNALSGFGGNMQGLSQDALNRIYADYQNSQQMPYLPYASQLAGLSQLGYNQSQWPSIVGGLGSLFGGLGQSGILGQIAKWLGGGNGSNGVDWGSIIGGDWSGPGWTPSGPTWGEGNNNIPWWVPGGGGIW